MDFRYLVTCAILCLSIGDFPVEPVLNCSLKLENARFHVGKNTRVHLVAPFFLQSFFRYSNDVGIQLKAPDIIDSRRLETIFC